MITLKSKVALVTGASGGIGSTTAVLLASLGADVFVHYHKNQEKAIKVQQEISELGRNCYLVSGNLTEQEDVKNIFRIIDEKASHLDILVNNAGLFMGGYAKYLTEENWDLALNTNMKSIFLCSKCAIKYLAKSSQGCIVNVSSIAAINARVGQLAYNASKAGVISMTKTMAKELAALHIRVNAVAPGPVRTKMREINVKEEERLNKLIPLKRIAEPEDVANTIAYLCSSIADYITGQVIQVDGGLTL